MPSKPAKKKWTPATLAQTTRANAGAIAIAFVKPPPDGCRSEDAANYVRGTEGLDLLYAHRPLARQLLQRATERDTPMGRLRVISVEGLISTAATGAEAVLAREAGVPFASVPDSTTQTDPFVEWLSLMEVVEILCPVWPVREHPMRGEKWRL